MAIIDQDTFNRANQAGWNPASGGSNWSQRVGTLTISIVSLEGSASGNVNPSIDLLGNGTATDGETTVRFSMSATSDSFALLLRGSADGKNGYLARQSGGTFSLCKLVNGAVTSLFSVAFTLSASIFYTMRFRLIGTVLYGRIWQDGTAEPAQWTKTGSDATFTAAGQFGVSMVLSTSTDTIQVDHFVMTDGVYSLGTPCQSNFLIRTGLVVLARSRFFIRSGLSVASR